MTQSTHGLTRLNIFLKECLSGEALNGNKPVPQTFGYILGHSNPVTGNIADETILKAFDELVDDMKTSIVTDGPAEAGMTFFGQFVDHDITLDATSAIGTEIDPQSIRNIRTPSLDLDCVYGDGPEASPHLYSPEHEGFLLFGRNENHLDLARNCKGTALIGDPRNDENIVVSQIQGAFICLHNILMSKAIADPATRSAIHACSQDGMRSDLWSNDIIPTRLSLFEDVRRFVRLHYQYLVLNDLLPSFVESNQLKAALLSDPFGGTGPLIPAEFSVAAYRFGHATVQPEYRLGPGEAAVDLFSMRGFQPRSSNSDVRFSEFFGDSGDVQRALPVGIKMAETLFELPFVHDNLKFRSTTTTVDQARKLGLRNLLRDRGSLLIASGQQLARHLSIDELDVPPILQSAGITKTPLWYYCLQEASDSGKLSGVGAAILGSVFGRLLRQDNESILQLNHFTPWNGFGRRKFSVAAVMNFVEDNRDSINHAPELRCG